ncbi:hypothetical protein AAIH70_25615 [Neorhizobium sp. BT27B]|uniref:hypothetical protein n=1 Tax=Neorhizobium sp. BT27B TaxID=3142625 RepID=UPI003D2E437E
MIADLVSGKPSKTETAPQTSTVEVTPAVPDAKKTAASTDDIAGRIEDVVVTSPEPENTPKREVIKDPATVDDTGPVAETKSVELALPIEEKAESVVSLETDTKPEIIAVKPPTVKAPAPAKPKHAVAKRGQQEIALEAVEFAKKANPSPKSDSDEMADLDRDIEDLRKQLAEKLKLQNAQLRNLIDRYEGP